MGKIDIDAAIGVVETIISSAAGQKFICGTYSNGKPRSVVDAWRDEVISPKDRERWEKEKRKKKKKRKKRRKEQEKENKKRKKHKNRNVFEI